MNKPSLKELSAMTARELFTTSASLAEYLGLSLLIAKRLSSLREHLGMPTRPTGHLLNNHNNQ